MKSLLGYRATNILVSLHILASACIILLLPSTHATSLLACFMNQENIFITVSRFSLYYRGDVVEILTNHMRYLSFETICKSSLIQTRIDFFKVVHKFSHIRSTHISGTNFKTLPS